MKGYCNPYDGDFGVCTYLNFKVVKTVIQLALSCPKNADTLDYFFNRPYSIVSPTNERVAQPVTRRELIASAWRSAQRVALRDIKVETLV